MQINPLSYGMAALRSMLGAGTDTVASGPTGLAVTAVFAAVMFGGAVMVVRPGGEGA